jgi:predicted ArsR family transcriptional regulator
MASKALRLEIASLAALDDPIRRRLYEYVVDQAKPVSRDMAASGVEIARHIAKFHLDKLVEEGLLEAEYRRPSGKTGPGAGRPTKYFRRSSREISVSIPERHYDLAARVLAQAITASQTGGISIASALEKTATSFGQVMAQEVQIKLGELSSKTEVADAISEVLDEHGYEPRKEDRRLLLANCPFHSLATEYTTLICGINHNLMNALINELPPSFTADLEPTPGRCCVTLNEI